MGIRYLSVSYTHLDVYKRQDLRYDSMVKIEVIYTGNATIDSIEQSRENVLVSIEEKATEAVSYTHLCLRYLQDKACESSGSVLWEVRKTTRCRRTGILWGLYAKEACL